MSSPMVESTEEYVTTTKSVSDLYDGRGQRLARGLVPMPVDLEAYTHELVGTCASGNTIYYTWKRVFKDDR